MKFVPLTSICLKYILEIITATLCAVRMSFVATKNPLNIKRKNGTKFFRYKNIYSIFKNCEIALIYLNAIFTVNKLRHTGCVRSV